MTSISDIEKQGGIVTGRAVKRNVSWSIGEDTFDADVFIHYLPYGDLASFNESQSPEWQQMIEIIIKSVRLGDEGEEKLTYDQAYALHPSLIMAFANSVMEVNGLGMEEEITSPKASTRGTSSGTS